MNQPVYAIAVQGGNVWLGGDFTMVNGTARQHLAQVNASTGALGAMAVAVNGHVNQLLLDGTGANLYVAGTFSTVGGHDPAQRRVDRHLVVRGRGADLPDADRHGLRHRAGRHDRAWT